MCAAASDPRVPELGAEPWADYRSLPEDRTARSSAPGEEARRERRVVTASESEVHGHGRAEARRARGGKRREEQTRLAVRQRQRERERQRQGDPEDPERRALEPRPVAFHDHF